VAAWRRLPDAARARARRHATVRGRCRGAARTDIWDRWFAIPERLSHPRLEDYKGYGATDPTEHGVVYSTTLLIWATDEDEARAIANALIDPLVNDAVSRRRLSVTRAHAADSFRLPHSPKDYEPKLVRKRWNRCEPSAVGVKIVWYTGPCPLAKIDVEETPQHVIITLWERCPPRFAQDGTRYGVAAIGLTRCVEVPLAAPLGGRAVIDGRTGAPPDEIDPLDTSAYRARRTSRSAAATPARRSPRRSSLHRLKIFAVARRTATATGMGRPGSCPTRATRPGTPRIRRGRCPPQEVKR
jgi:hypothetical protein